MDEPAEREREERKKVGGEEGEYINPRISEQRVEYANPKISEQRVEYANPRAPEHVKAPVFSVPLSKRMQKASGTMTPRAVTASIRAYSSVVMTPHAESSSTTSTVPRLKARSGRTVRGPKESAPDRPIFSKDEEENYVDRAAERRAAVKRETKLQSERHSKDDGWETTPPHKSDDWEMSFHKSDLPQSSPHERWKEEEGVRMELDLSETRRLKAKEEKRSEFESIAKPFGSSKMIENMCQIMGIPLPTCSSKSAFNLSSSNNKFTDGKMAYIYDVMSNTPPKTLLQGRVKRMETAESLDIVNVIGAAFRPKSNISQMTKSSTDPDEDIFPDAGEYAPVPASATGEPVDRKISKPPIQNLFDKTVTTSTLSGSQLPKSIENIIDRQGYGEERALERGYEECYPETDIFYNSDDDDDDDDGTSSTSNIKGTSTKRQLRRKQSQKLESQVKKVTKILAERGKEQ
jgi:hypothetical protein